MVPEMIFKLCTDLHEMSKALYELLCPSPSLHTDFLACPQYINSFPPFRIFLCLKCSYLSHNWHLLNFSSLILNFLSSEKSLITLSKCGPSALSFSRGFFFFHSRMHGFLVILFIYCPCLCRCLTIRSRLLLCF